tara:strand:+ start:67 stop:306 length:240 start_codon:yes stop_codon:yes gene_type:complete
MISNEKLAISGKIPLSKADERKLYKSRILKVQGAFNKLEMYDILFKKKGIIQGLYADVGLSFFEQFAVLLPSDTRFYDS